MTGSAPGLPRAGTCPTAFERAFDDSDLHGLRAAVATYVTGIAGADAAETVVLIAHELCSNAVRHGGGSGRIRLWVAGDGEIHCEVTDQGPGLTDPDVGHSLPPPSLPGGRGLWIARNMSELRIVTGATGTTITAVFSR
ncbi:ATP-binding protein [Symbioplanes lichenis]|uniref:ATP-binding protein n=1 Tax=Symbioplanes lichenis TaxID=1629072 RepID=UPI00273A4042|nr:ATP-binding protein [Actinoplanes lichenis]